MRNDSYWTDAGKEAAEKQCTVCNSAIADAIIDQGGLFYRDNSSSAFDFMGIGQRMMTMNESCEILDVFLFLMTLQT